MHTIDWLIMILPLLICGSIAIYSRRYVRSVADFMAGGRGAGRFLICAAKSEQGSGAVVFVAVFQVFIVSGFTLRWWGLLTAPVGMLLAISGWVIYRYRQTRAMTLGQFFEMRYSRKFRLFAGALGFFAGLVNFGIIPATGARFMVAFLDLQQEQNILGLQVPTYLLLMALFLTICVIMTTTAGQVSVLLTDCAEGMFSQLFYTLIAIILLVGVFNWPETKAVLLHTAPGKSLVNPFDSSGLRDFNIWYVMIGIYGMFYNSISWQNSHAFNSSAATPHEARMGSLLSHWRTFAAGVMIVLLSVCALTFMNTHPAAIDAKLSLIPDVAIRDQMRSPLALTMMLPVGVKGMLLSICLMGIIAGDGIHLHSWGSILIQDCIMPLRKDPLTPQQHIRLLRLSILGVAVFAFLFGWLFPQTKFVQFWFTITGAIFISGAGIVIIGGLYWSRGTATAAWTSLTSGAIGAMVGLGTLLYYERVLQRDLNVSIFGHVFRLNIPWISFLDTIFATSLYVLISKLTCRQPHNMDRLLHRGQYSVAGDVIAVPAGPKRSWLKRIFTFGVTDEFSRSDRWIAIGITSWSLFWFSVFLLVCFASIFHHFSNETWADYWLWTGIYLPLVIGVGTTIWFTIGCWKDMKSFFRRLREEKVDFHDDGSVVKEQDGHGFPVLVAEAVTDLELPANQVAAVYEGDPPLGPGTSGNV